jgi:hypothetical protein
VKFVQHATGFDYAQYIVKAYAGIPTNDLAMKGPEGFCTRHVMMADRNGVFDGITYDESIRGNIIEDLMVLKQGDEIKNAFAQKVGIVFLKYDSKDEMNNKNSKIHELVKVHVR